MQKICEDIDKQDLPEQEGQPEEEEKKAEPAQTVEKAFLDAINKGGLIFELDNLGIRSLR